MPKFPTPRPAQRTEAGVLEVHRRFPTAGDAIVLYAEEAAADLIVMGTHGRRGWDRARLGSVAEGVARYASCPVLVIPSAAVDAASGARAAAQSA
ncbi:MAG TPA: universal stress protein [Bacteroidetes bacterium]|nr:universal stress protein [Bacteroidota bacterium]